MYICNRVIGSAKASNCYLAYQFFNLLFVGKQKFININQGKYKKEDKKSTTNSHHKKQKRGKHQQPMIAFQAKTIKERGKSLNSLSMETHNAA